jgi:hypothetical protein
VSADDCAAHLPLSRCQTVRRKQQSHQMIAAGRLDGDCDLFLVPTDQRTCVEDGPLAVCDS